MHLGTTITIVISGNNMAHVACNAYTIQSYATACLSTLATRAAAALFRCCTQSHSWHESAHTAIRSLALLLSTTYNKLLTNLVNKHGLQLHASFSNAYTFCLCSICQLLLCRCYSCTQPAQCCANINTGMGCDNPHTNTHPINTLLFHSLVQYLVTCMLTCNADICTTAIHQLV
jgi:hypothetical protein